MQVKLLADIVGNEVVLLQTLKYSRTGGSLNPDNLRTRAEGIKNLELMCKN